MKNYIVPKQLLKGKIILVTGASDGIGKAVALNYAQYGATVILHGRNIERLEKIYDQIIDTGGNKPAIIPLDLSKATTHDYQQLAITIQNEFGRLDGIVHNAAAITDLTPIEHTDHTSWNEIMQVNINAVFMITQTCLPLLKSAPSASIITTSSGVGRKGRAYWGAYSVSKFAIEGFTQVLADELENTNIRINAVNPGSTRTKMRAVAFPAEDQSQLPDPSELIPTYLYLMGDDSQNVNGESLNAQ